MTFLYGKSPLPELLLIQLLLCRMGVKEKVEVGVTRLGKIWLMFMKRKNTWRL